MSTYSSNLGIELITPGDQAGVWGTTTNNNWSAIMELAATGYLSVTVSDAPASPTTLTIPNGIVSGQGDGRNLYYVLTGTLTADRNLIIPNKNKIYYFYNNTTGGFSVTVKVSGQTGVTIANGKKYVLVCNGTDAIDALPIDMTRASNTLPVANGGTGATTLAGANIALTNTTNTFSGPNTFSALQTFNGSSSVAATLFKNALETVQTSVALSGTATALYLTSGSVFLATASADFVINVRLSSGSTLDSAMANNQSVTMSILLTQGTTAYKFATNGFQIDGSAVTVKWQGGTTPTGNASSTDVISFVIVKTATSTYTVLGSFTKFA